MLILIFNKLNAKWNLINIIFPKNSCFKKYKIGKIYFLKKSKYFVRKRVQILKWINLKAFSTLILEEKYKKDKGKKY